MTEIWRTAVYDGKIYEGLYKVSNWGRIKNINYRNTGRERLITPSENKGYLRVQLWKNGKGKMCTVHRLVAETFIPNPDNLPQVNHIDENKINNRVENLEWKSPKDNCNHGTRNERMRKALTNGKLSKKVLQFTKSGELIREWESTRECGRNGFNQSNVAACCRGDKPQYKGFIWKYEED